MNVEPWDTIGVGAEGPRVRALQYLLRSAGFALAVDGDFGPGTRARVQDFQHSRGLPVTGALDPITWPHLVTATSLGSTGDAVRGLQSLGLVLIPDQPPLVVDGSFGMATEGRVRSFQESWGLTPKGGAGRAVWSVATAAHWPGPLVKVGAVTATNFRVPIVQHLLRAHGATLVADGIVGPITGEAVRQFQLSLRPTHISTTVGQLDWPNLIITVHPGGTGEAVKAVQSAYPDLEVDGEYGPLTRARVDQTQEVFGGADGVVDHQTWRAIIGPVFE